MATHGFIDGLVRESESFDIAEYLNYMMDVHNVLANERGVTLTLKLEPGFPREIAGERQKFEIVVSAVLTYLISQSERNKEVVLEAKLKNPNEDGLLLRFEFLAFLGGKTNLNQLAQTLDTVSETLPEDPGKETVPLDFALTESRWIVKWLKGNVEVVTLSGLSRFAINVDIQFGSYDNKSPLHRKKPLGLFETRKLSNYTTTWTDSTSKARFAEREEAKVPQRADSGNVKPVLDMLAAAQLKDKILRAVKARDNKGKDALNDRVKEEIKTKLLTRTVLSAI